jgi:hypothetical protein
VYQRSSTDAPSLVSVSGAPLRQRGHDADQFWVKFVVHGEAFRWKAIQRWIETMPSKYSIEIGVISIQYSGLRLLITTRLTILPSRTL